MSNKKLLGLCSIVISILSSSFFIQSSEDDVRLTAPCYYNRKGYTLPLSPGLLAAFTGDMVLWSDAQIMAVMKEEHPESGDTIAHIACNTATLERILSCSKETLFRPNADLNIPVQQFVRRHHATGLLVTAFTYLENIPNGTDWALNEHRNKFGDTTAHCAVAARQYKYLRILYKYGANLDLKNNNKEDVSQTALRLLRQNQLHASLFFNAIRQPFSPISTVPDFPPREPRATTATPPQEPSSFVVPTHRRVAQQRPAPGPNMGILDRNLPTEQKAAVTNQQDLVGPEWTPWSSANLGF